MKTKTKIISVLSILGILLVIWSYNYTNYIGDFYKWQIKISNLYSISPEELYKKAKLERQVYFLGVLGEGLELPGIEGDLNFKHKIIIIDSTGDVIYSKGQEQFKEKAQLYAKDFNLKMMKDILPDQR